MNDSWCCICGKITCDEYEWYQCGDKRIHKYCLDKIAKKIDRETGDILDTLMWEGEGEGDSYE